MTPRKVFGKAADFYRSRVLTIDETELADMEWRSDILYRQPEATAPSSHMHYVVEVVEDATDRSYLLAACPNREMAEAMNEQVTEDLRELTKMEFDRKYLGRKPEEPAPGAPGQAPSDVDHTS